MKVEFEIDEMLIKDAAFKGIREKVKEEVIEILNTGSMPEVTPAKIANEPVGAIESEAIFRLPYLTMSLYNSGSSFFNLKAKGFFSSLLES